MINKVSILLGMVLIGCSYSNVEEKPNPRKQYQTVSMEINLLDSVGGSIRGMDIFDDQVILSGQFGMVYSLKHDEETIVKMAIPGAQNRDIRDVVKVNDSTLICMAIGSPGVIYRYSGKRDGWEVVYHNDDSLCFLDAIKFWNDSIGLAVGDPIDDKMFVLKTTDGGKSWERLHNLPDRLEIENAFAASGTSIAIGSNGIAWIGLGGLEARVFKTTDYGKSWSVTSTPLLCGDAAQGIYSICFKDDLNGIVAGGNWEKHLSDSSLACTTDGGNTWHLPNTTVDGYRSCVTQGGANESPFFVSCGTSGLDISLDNGRNWQKLGENNLNVVRFMPQSDIGYAADSRGNVYRIRVNRKAE